MFGVASQENGKLTIDSGDLQDALSIDRDSIASIFADPDNGIIAKFDSVIGSFIDFEGVIDGKTDSLNRRIDSVASSRESMSRRIDAFEARITLEFNSLDTLVAQLRSSGNFLNQQLSLIQPTNS